VEWTKSSRNWIGAAGDARVVGFGVERTDIQSLGRRALLYLRLHIVCHLLEPWGEGGP
jgi:hypothetical protein